MEAAPQQSGGFQLKYCNHGQWCASCKAAAVKVVQSRAAHLPMPTVAIIVKLTGNGETSDQACARAPDKSKISSTLLG